MKLKSEPPPRKLEQIDDEALESFRNIPSVKGNKPAEDADGGNDSDNEVNVRAHRKLLTAIEKIDRTQHIRAPARTEVATRESEFHVVKSEGIIKRQEKFSFNKLNNVSKKSSATVAKDLKKLSRSKKRLAKPLEKPVAERISRGIAYEKARLDLDRWEAVVQKNRFDDCLVFPQQSANDIAIEEDSHEKTPSYRIKSDLMLELEALDAKRPGREAEAETPQKDAKSEGKLSKKELLVQQKELARLRRKESYEIEKARRQNKIKSKKYHKVMKKEKIRKQVLEFEKLQKSDPEEALRRLELIEKSRIAERSQLRHRNTGSWAKNLQIRAKYDKEARRDLSEQLSIGRELKQQKQKEESEASDQEEDAADEKTDDYDPFNPWQRTEAASDEVFDGYRKYWMQRNANEQKKQDYEMLEIPENSKSITEETPVGKGKEKRSSGGLLWTVEDIEEGDYQLSTTSLPPEGNQTTGKKKKLTKKASKVKKKSIDEIFDVADQKLDRKITRKIEKLRKVKENPKKSRQERRKEGNQDENHLNLELKKNAQRPEIDEALEESTERRKGDNSQGLDNIKAVLSSGHEKETPEEVANIAPDNFATVEIKSLNTALPDMMHEEDDGEEVRVNGKLSLTEAFEDDDIFKDFSREKSDQIAADQPQDIDLTLPGWGSWTGQGVVKRQKRMILKFPKNLPRKDSTKNSVIINEILSEKAKEHLVRDLPYPFTSVRDFEASIRAPVGRTFVPETAHRVLTKPNLVTKMGTIIEPMDEKVLLNADKPQRVKTTTDRRIEKLFEKEDEIHKGKCLEHTGTHS
ncbi:U3 small nucleolar RNA-associated protein 14 homolog A isoform X2 [Lutzomyia longipalpis]|uniref:U3 small nucleolar RNA-associated protein 14 homolog A isoform X2 n=1 Tax=Lutzomyia longipalpis TaxID=7200 RepID=UPI0024842FAF|nr:U3 small nucleolar RNA-associated protein 14 homolog A isoform X2 [Lutzomyia longipalpis]